MDGTFKVSDRLIAIAALRNRAKISYRSGLESDQLFMS